MRLSLLFVLLMACSGAEAAAAPFVSNFSVANHATSRMGVVRLDTWTLRRDRAPGGGPVTLVLVTLPRGTARARIVPVSRGGSSTDLFRPALCPGGVAINGGFFLRRGAIRTALGLVRVNGRTLSKPSRRRSGGLLAINDGELEVLPRREIARALRATDAIESTPVVIEGRRNAMRSDDGVRFDRVAIGRAADGGLLIVGAFGRNQDSVSLWELGVLARAAMKAQGGLVQDLLAMDGGPSAHILFGDRLFGYRGPAYLPNAVCVTPR